MVYAIELFELPNEIPMAWRSSADEPLVDASSGAMLFKGIMIGMTVALGDVLLASRMEKESRRFSEILKNFTLAPQLNKYPYTDPCTGEADEKSTTSTDNNEFYHQSILNQVILEWLQKYSSFRATILIPILYHLTQNYLSNSVQVYGISHQRLLFQQSQASYV